MAVDGLEQNFSLESEISPKRGLKPGSGGEGDPDFDSRFGGVEATADGSKFPQSCMLTTTIMMMSETAMFVLTVTDDSTGQRISLF